MASPRPSDPPIREGERAASYLPSCGSSTAPLDRGRTSRTYGPVNLLLLFPEDELGSSRYRVTGPRAKHLLEVLEVAPGHALHVGRVNGPTGRATVTSTESDAVELAVELEEALPEAPRARLVLAVPRPKVLRRLLPQLAALGLHELVLLRTWRVERSYLESDILDPARYRPLLHEGLMQACRTHEPRVQLEPRFRPYVEDRLGVATSGDLRIVAHPRAKVHVADLAVPPCGARTAVIGPEAGLIDREVDLLERVGFTPARITRGILKVETAAVAALAQLELLAVRTG